MIEQPIIREFSSLTISDLIDIVKEFDLSDQFCLNSCFTKEYTLSLCESETFNMFEPICGVNLETYQCEFWYEFSNKNTPIKISVIMDKLSKSENLSNEIERDVDDGYRFESFETVIITQKNLIFL